MNNKHENFDYNIEQINKNITINKIQQEEIMNSKNFNTTMQSIEDGLNSLYEKCRYLEESIEYAKVFLNQTISDYDLQISNALSSIESIKDVNKNMGYLDYVVPFQENVTEISDRYKDYKINPCKLDRDKNILTLSEKYKQDRPCSSYLRTTYNTPYDSNFKKFQDDGEKYRVVYIEDKPIQDGITENILCYLPYVQEVNSIDIKTVNCNISDITLVYQNGLEEKLDNIITGINNQSRMCTHVKTAFNCQTYDLVQYELDETLIKTDNIWDLLNEFEYTLNVNKDTKIEVEALIKRTVMHSSTKEVETKVYRSTTNNTIKVNKYVYVFGVDYINLSNVVLNHDSYFISENVNIGTLNETEYVQLDVKDNIGEYSGIEYYIVDGDMEIPILPIGTKFVYNERVFPETNLRFNISDSLYAEGIGKVKKDGMSIDTEYSNIKDLYDATYCLSYEPSDDSYKYTPINSSIRVKAIIRNYGDIYDTIPYIDNIIIKKYGGSTLWTNVY